MQAGMIKILFGLCILSAGEILSLNKNTYTSNVKNDNTVVIHYDNVTVDTNQNDWVRNGYNYSKIYSLFINKINFKNENNEENKKCILSNVHPGYSRSMDFVFK